MGIPNLNKLLVDNCSNNAINKINLRELDGKTVVIDTSIYLYKYLGQNKLVEHFYLLISLLLHYKITPIFVFDGKPPAEKMETLKQRKQNKRDAEHKFYELQESISEETTDADKQTILTKMDALKKDFIRIRDVHIQTVKQLMKFYGISYIDAPNEADVVCCELVISGQAWACLSDDMDMFLYGCNRVLRFISLLNHTAILYDTGLILHDLEMSLTEFRYLSVPCGTDYNSSGNQKISIYQMYKHFKNYKKDKKTSFSFDAYLLHNKFVENAFYEICDMFCLDNNNTLHYEIVNNEKNSAELQTFLTNYGFVFV